jgi:WD40 repeat protein
MFELLFFIFAALQAQKMIVGNTPSTKRCLPYPSGAVCLRIRRELLRRGLSVLLSHKLIGQMSVRTSRHFIFSILLRFNLIPELKIVKRMPGNNPVFNPDGGFLFSKPNKGPEHDENEDLEYGDLFVYSQSPLDASPIFRHASLGKNTPIQLMVMHPSGKLFFMGCYDISGTHSLVCYRFAENDTIVSYTILHGHQDSVNAIAVNSAGNFIASGSSEKVILWKIYANGAIFSIGRYNFGMCTLCLAFHHEKMIFAAGGLCNNVSLWGVEPDGTLQSLSRLKGHTSYVLDVKFLPKGRVATAGTDKTIIIWNTSSDFKQVMSLKKILSHQDRVSNLCLHPNGRIMVSASASGDNKLIVWWLSHDNSSAIKIQVLDGHHYGVEQVVLDPSGRQLVSSGSNELIVWQ